MPKFTPFEHKYEKIELNSYASIVFSLFAVKITKEKVT